MITNVLNAYIGDSSVSRLYQGDQLIYDAVHPDILLEYIANGPDDNSSRNVYFDTSVSENVTNPKIEVKAAAYRTVTVTNVMGAYRNQSWDGLALYFHRDGGNNISCRFHTTVVTDDVSLGQNVPTTVTFFWDKSQVDPSNANKYKCIVIRDGVTTTSSGYAQFLSRDVTLYLMTTHKLNTDSTTEPASNVSGLKMYYCKIWEDNNLIRFYIPVLHYINGQYTPCFYDKVNDNYIYNLGTDTPTYKIQGDYLLDYLGAPPEQSIPNTTSYIMRYDSDVVASTNLQTDTKFRLVYGRENFIYGSGTSGQTTPSWQQYSLLCPGSLYRLSANFGSRAEGGLGGTLLQETSEVCDVHTCSAYFDQELGRMYLDSALKWQAAFATSYLSSNTIHLFSRHGDSSNINAGAGSRIYYINFTKSNVPVKTYVPVLHNNQAAFLDLNTNTYIYNLGTDTPSYSF